MRKHLAPQIDEDELITMLQDFNGEVRMSAAMALGVYGTARALPALMDMSRQAIGPLGTVAVDAITSIHSRIGWPEAGSLTLADPSEEGGLTIVSNEADET